MFSRVWNKILAVASFISLYGGLVGIVTLGLIIVTMVLIRQFGGSAWGFIELVKLQLLASGGLTLAFTQRAKQHVALDILIHRWSKRARERLAIIYWLGGIFVAALLLLQFTKATYEFWRAGEYWTGFTKIPLWPYYTIFTIGVVLFLLFLIHHFVQSIKVAFFSSGQSAQQPVEKT